MCPLIFWNIKLTVLSIHRISLTFIETNQIGFQQLSNDLFLNEMNSKILHLQLYIYRSELNANILNKHVFKQLKAIDLNGQITKIQDDLFKSFKNLNFIRFRIQYVKKVFVQNNKWLNNINYEINIDPSIYDNFANKGPLLMRIYAYEFTRVNRRKRNFYTRKL